MPTGVHKKVVSPFRIAFISFLNGKKSFGANIFASVIARTTAMVGIKQWQGKREEHCVFDKNMS